MTGLSNASFMNGLMRGYRFVTDEADRVDRNRKNDDLHARQMRAMDRNDEMQEIQLDTAKLRYNQFKKKDEDMANQTLAWSMLNWEKAPPEIKEMGKNYPNFNASHLLGDEMGRAIEIAEKAITGKIPYNSPEVAQAFDVINPEIALGAKDGRKVKTNKLYLGKKPAHLMVGLQVEGDSEERPLTEGRTANNDDPVREVDAKDLIGRVMEIKNYRSVLLTPEGRQWFIQAHLPQGGKYGELQFDEKHNIAGQYGPDGKFHQVNLPKNGGFGGAGGAYGADGKPTELIRNMEYLTHKFKNEGLNLTTDKAFLMAKMAVSNPEDYVSEYVKAKTANLLPTEKPDMNALTQEAVTSWRDMRAKLFELEKIKVDTGNNQGDGSKSGEDEMPASVMTPEQQQQFQEFSSFLDKATTELSAKAQKGGFDSGLNSAMDSLLSDPLRKAVAPKQRLSDYDQKVSQRQRGQ